MAAYAAVVSLLNTVGKIQNHAHLSTSFDKKQVESLCDQVGFLKDFLKSNSQGEGQADLERQIAYAASTAEDLIQSHVAVKIRSGYAGDSNAFLPDLQTVLKDVDAIKKRAMKTVTNLPLLRSSGKSVASSTRAPPIRKTNLVGLEEQKNEIVERLTDGQPSRQVIPIIGMGGIGKTTLARFVYEDPRIVDYFDIKIWITISQQYTVRDLLLQFPNNEQSSTEDQLGQELYKSLFDRRYLIILDDMWSTEAWNNIQHFFPNNGNKSRILVTTRLSNVAIHFSSCSFEVNFLDQDECWKLFCDKVFGEKVCPPELEDIGREIVQKCKGLPLSIVIIGGLLAKSCMTQLYWESVAKDINSILNSEDESHCLGILSLSYSHLSSHLKPCFLYMGIFPEDREIPISLLIKLWIVEGFLESNNDKSLEEVAKDYLKDLVDRNIIIAGKWGLNGKIKTCYIHDLVRDLCLKISEKEDFIYTMEGSKNREAIHHLLSYGFSWKSICLYTYSPISLPPFPMYNRTSVKSNENYEKLRVWSNIVLTATDECIYEQVNLKFIYWASKNGHFKIPSSVSLLWNLQIIICTSSHIVHAPSEIWEIKELRHVDFQGKICLPDPPICRADEGGSYVLRNLHTLMVLSNFKWSEEVLKRILYIKKLKVSYSVPEAADVYCLHNISQFQELESLNFQVFVNEKMRILHMMQDIRLPCSLQKITFGASLGMYFQWDDLAIFGSLPHLEVLKIQCEVRGTEWNPNEGEFRSLKSLRVDWCRDLIHWNADSCHFPILENLFMDRAYQLDEIPFGIGDIPTLKSISLLEGTASAAISTIRILDEQEGLGNEGLKVQVSLKDHDDRKSLFGEEIPLQYDHDRKSFFSVEVAFQGRIINNFCLETSRYFRLLIQDRDHQSPLILPPIPSVIYLGSLAEMKGVNFLED